MLLVVGCTTVSPPRPGSPDAARTTHQTEELGWWYARFQMEWPKDAEPRWHMDVLLASEVLAPVIEDYRGEMALWRFHRRAARDAAGHQFSFIFYAGPNVAARIFDSIRASSLIVQLQKSGDLLAVTCDTTAAVHKPNIEDTSDPNWSPVLQRSWPYFIMGVSELWLTLVTQIAEGQTSPGMPATLERKLDSYRKVDQTVQALWNREGGHALLHHLNAIFQYEPIMVNRREPMQF
jgi:hypothetical protein